LQVCFNGAALGFLRSAKAFIDAAGEAYAAGWTVDEVLDALEDEEFAQSGGALPFALARPSRRGQAITAAVFARWLSVVYMALAQLGVPFPNAGQQLGWAWTSRAAVMAGWSSIDMEDSDVQGPEGSAIASSSSAAAAPQNSNQEEMGLQAYGLAEFVQSALQRAEQSDAEGSASDEEGYARKEPIVSEAQAAVQAAATAAAAEGGASQSTAYEGFSMVVVEDPHLGETSSFVLMMSQLISLVRLTRDMVVMKHRMR
jgi:hypothetical protein